VENTLQFFREGKSVPEIARIRGVKDSTIYGHLEQALLAGEKIDVNTLVPTAAQREIADAFARHGFVSLAPIVESFAGKYGYGECRLVRAALQTGRTR
jgi:ATP-dependent DNA helicase RecQ